jgi:hypothetical protein
MGASRTRPMPHPTAARDDSRSAPVRELAAPGGSDKCPYDPRRFATRAEIYLVPDCESEDQALEYWRDAQLKSSKNTWMDGIACRGLAIQEGSAKIPTLVCVQLSFEDCGSLRRCSRTRRAVIPATTLPATYASAPADLKVRLSGPNGIHCFLDSTVDLARK